MAACVCVCVSLQAVPLKGAVSLPTYDYPQQFSEFSFRTLLTKAEVISALVKIRVECAKVSTQACVCVCARGRGRVSTDGVCLCVCVCLRARYDMLIGMGCQGMHGCVCVCVCVACLRFCV